MGGGLSVESTIGVGSRFSFALKFELVTENFGEMRTHDDMFYQILDKPNFQGEVLVCEDNNLNQQVICDHLSRVGLNCVVAQNGKEGVEIVEARMKAGDKPFDLILMDIHMPIMDGLEATLRINEMGLETPIIALTANIMSNDTELYKASGMTDFVGKPYTSQDLWKCLVKYLPVVSYTAMDGQYRFSEDEKLQRLLKINFAHSNKDTYERIIAAIDDGNRELAHRLAHTLKGNAAQIGKERLREVAATVEAELSKGKTQLNKRERSRLEAELNAVLEELSPLLAEAGPGEISEKADMEKMYVIIEELEPLLLNRNPESMDMLDDIRTIPGAGELIRYVEDFKFKQAIAELSLLKKRIGME
jgi:CheY-like chemotaxis protein